MSAAADFRAAVAFLTPLDLSRSTEPPPPPSPRTMAYFPVVGGAIGALVGVTVRLARRSLPPPVAAALAVAADCALTGALHLDGLADAADGLLAHAPAKDRLAIMAEPGTGSFAAVAVSLALLTRAASLAALEPSPSLLAALYCSSRSAMVIGSRWLPYARRDGLVSAFLPEPTNPRQVDPSLIAAALGALGALGLSTAVAGRRGAAAVVAGWGAAALVLECSRKRIGGFTGDVLGAAGVCCETCALVVAASGARG